MAEWTVCPSCNLKHSIRADRLCPRCRTGSDELPSAVSSAAPEAPTGIRLQSIQVGMWSCANHPHKQSDLLQCARCGRHLCRDCVVTLRDMNYCADCKSEKVRDIQSGSAYGSDFGEYQLASVVGRYGALVIDRVIQLATMFVFGMLAAARGVDLESGDALITTVWFAVCVTYEGVMLQARGQTLGKIVMGIRVVTPDGEGISPGQAWGRAAAKVALGGCLGVNYIPALFTAENTCLHDMLAKTRVVRLLR
jgi:uncharacterized RDD family membrane protein YckC